MLCLGQFDVAKCISWVFAYNMKARRGLLLTVFLLVPQYYKRYWITMQEVLNGSPIQHFLQAKKTLLTVCILFVSFSGIRPIGENLQSVLFFSIYYPELSFY